MQILIGIIGMCISAANLLHLHFNGRRREIMGIYFFMAFGHGNCHTCILRPVCVYL